MFAADITRVQTQGAAAAWPADGKIMGISGA
ncbi:hypothetical protein X740_22100 [Mesorhizobium sp. LNHC221B00]|nr:hypothetical protein X740_22100 [Mesorhizobium sp. LNHC221B00]